MFDIFLPGPAMSFTPPSAMGMILVSDTVEEQREHWQQKATVDLFLPAKPCQ